MTEDLAQKLVDFVKNASTSMWNTAYKQVYVEVFQTALWLLFALVLLGILIWVYKKVAVWLDKKSYNYDENVIGTRVLDGICIVFLVVFIVIGLIEIGSRLINPDLYAIKVLLGLIKLL